ncbi:sensor histidine kinase [Pseudodesulfovibrio sp.]|nr:sensor histidine kinase [Pseudodesulfovibrio sp.]
MKQLVRDTLRWAVPWQGHIAGALVTAACWLLLFAAPAHAQPERRVLLLNSYGYDFTWTANITKGVEDVLVPLGGDIKLSVEFMDTKNFFSPEYLAMLVEQLRFKYADVHLDAIITSDDNAINFVLEHRDLFGGAPVVFCGVNNINLGDDPRFLNMTGAFEVVDVVSTINIMMDQNPGMETLYIISDRTPTAQYHRKNLEKDLPQFSGRLDIQWLEDLSVAELTESLKVMPADSVAIIISFYKDRLGQAFTSSEIMRIIRQACTRPIYSMWDFLFGEGIVGGMLTSGRLHGMAAAEMVLRILDGEKPENIRPLTGSVNRFMFDYAELERFQIPETTIPPDSIVINAPEPIYEKYTYEIWIIAGVMVFMLVVILILLVNIRARKNAEEDLEEFNRYQETLIDQRTEELIERSRELEIANYELKKLDELKTAVLNTVSHDLRTPLTSVLGFCKIIDRDFNKHFLPLCHHAEIEERGERIKGNLAIVEKEGERLTRLINDFLDLSKIESGDIAWNDVSVDPTQLIEQAVPVLEGYFSGTGVKLAVHADPNLPKVIADPDRLLQVLNNLVGNAAKFTYHGEVSLTATTTEGGWLKIIVSDTGVGIPQPELDHIFDKFYQVAQSTTDTDVSRGSGMGLAISKRIVEHYRGTITAESSPNSGSSFIFTIPSAG